LANFDRSSLEGANCGEVEGSDYMDVPIHPKHHLVRHCSAGRCNSGIRVGMRGILSGGALTLALALRAIGQDIPKDEAGFTDFVAHQLRVELGEATVVIQSPLTLKLGGLQANLDRIYSFCNNNAARCSAEVANYVKGTAETYKAQNAPITREAIRVVVRTTQYVQQTQASFPPDTPALLSKPFVEGLVLLPVLDSPRTLRLLNIKDLQTLGLTEEETQQLGLANLRTALKPLMEVARVAITGSIGQLIGDSFNPSRLALIDIWAPLAEAQGGKLIVVAPASDAVFYVGDDSPIALEALRALARNVMSQAPHPLSEILLRWKPNGWEVVR
jgi:uncharacterized protein YtpQ (UPF0354 family)